MASDDPIQLPLPSIAIDLKPERYQTCLVRRLRDKQEMIIAERDFDGAIYERVSAPTVERKTIPKKVVKYSRKELALMTIEALQSLPEAAGIEDIQHLGTKDEIIDAILTAE